MKNIQNILVPVDFSEESKNALDSALSLARDTSAQLIVLHVFDKTAREYREAALEYYLRLHDGQELSVFAPTLDQWLQQKLVDLAKFIQPMLQPSFTVTIKKRVELGTPVSNIMRIAKEENVDLIVLAVKQRRFLFYVMGRSILLKLVLKSRCAVLLIGADREISALPSIVRRLFVRNNDSGILKLQSHAARPAH